MSVCKWGHARLEIEEHVEDFDHQFHMGHVGEFYFSVIETCLSCDHNIFMVAPSDTDSHNPLLVRLKPSDMGWKEKHAYVPPEKKVHCKERRKDIQKQDSARILVMDALYWIRHGTTEMADIGGHRIPTLVMVAPLLPRHGNGDLRTDECILLKREDNTRWFFALCSFSESWFLLHKMFYTLATRRQYHSRVQTFVFGMLIFTLYNGEIISHLSPHISHWADQFCWERFLYQFRFLSVVHLNVWLWRSDLQPCSSCFGHCLYRLTWNSESCIQVDTFHR